MKIKQATIFFFLSGLWIAYLTIRAYYVPFTFDESATFFHFVQPVDFWFFTSLPDANNHLINTLLTYLSYTIFGSSKFALRLPNLLVSLIFLYYLYRTSLFLKNNSIRWIFLLSLMFSHYFMEFFAVSRGYGLSMAFLFGTLYYLMKFSTDISIKHLCYISGFLFLVLFSNLSMLVLAIAIIAYQIIVLLFSKKINNKQLLYRLALIFLLEVLPIVFAAYYMFYLQGRDSLYYGDTSGFWTLTVMSLIWFLTGSRAMVFAVVVIAFVFFLVFGVTFLIWKEKPGVLLQPKFVFIGLLFSTIVGLLLLTEIFGVNNPEDRVAMYLIPLFIGSVAMLADALVGFMGKKFFIVATLPLLFLPIHFFSVMNLQYLNGYIIEVIPEHFYETIRNDGDNQDEFPATIGGYKMRLFSWNYLNFENGGHQNLIDYQDYPEVECDYQIVDVDEYPEWLKYYEVIDTEKVLGRNLLKHKKKNEYQFLRTSKVNSTAEEFSGEFFALATWSVDTLVANTCIVNIDLDIHSAKIPFHAWVVLDVSDKSGTNLLYRYIPFDWLRASWDMGADRFKHSILTHRLPPESHILKLYIWNMNQSGFVVESGEIELHRLKKY